MISLLLAATLAQAPFLAKQGNGNDGGWPWWVHCDNCSGGPGGGVNPVTIDGGSVAVLQLTPIWNVGGMVSIDGGVTVLSLPAISVDGGLIAAKQNGAWDLTCTIDGGISVVAMPTVTVNTHAVTQSGAWTNACTLAGQMVSIDGGVTLVSGSTTAVTQATGTNLHAVIDTGSTTACTQATAANLNMTAAQPTAANLNATVAQSGTWTDRVVGNAGGAIDAANNATAPANVVVMGVQLQSGATATAGTAGQVGSPVAGLDHVLYSRAGGPVQWSCFVEAVTATTQCQAAPAAGLKAYVTSAQCSNEAFASQGVDIVYGTGAACVTGTTALTHKMRMGPMSDGGTPGGIYGDDFITPLQPAAASAICVRPIGATAFGCTLTGYTAP